MYQGEAAHLSLREDCRSASEKEESDAHGTGSRTTVSVLGSSKLREARPEQEEEEEENAED